MHDAYAPHAYDVTRSNLRVSDDVRAIFLFEFRHDDISWLYLCTCTVLILHMVVFGWFVALALALPSWNSLESKLPSVSPLVYDECLPDDESIQSTMPVLYRDKDAICPYSQQVWLALEMKNIEYATVLLSSSSTTTNNSPLQLTWPDGTIQTDSLDMLEKIQQEYPNHPPNLYPKGISECLDAVRCNIVRFKGVFPRRTYDCIYAPYLFLEKGGGLVSDSNLMVTLEETDEVLEEYFQGPFLCGKDVTAADVVWAPFLERYAVQLPCLHPDKPELHPRGGGEYEALQEWYQVMESSIPCYSCRVQGNVQQWKRALELGVQEHDANVVLPDDDNPVVFSPHEMDANALWKEYSENRPWLADTPEEECVAYLVRNRHDIAKDACKELPLDENNVDTALRELIAVLLDKDSTGEKLSGNAREVAAFVRDRIAVPRDLGMIPAATLDRIVERAPAPRIA